MCGTRGSNPPKPHYYHLFISDILFFLLNFFYVFVVFWWLIRSSFQASWKELELLSEPMHEKTNNRGFRPGLTQTRLYSHRSRIEALNFRIL